MEYFWLILIIALILVGLFFNFILRRVVIFEYERGILYRNGKFNRVLEPGAYYMNRYLTSVTRVDVRRRAVTLQGQEMLSADNVGIRVSMAATFQIVDPRKAINSSTNYMDEIYLILQAELRDLVGEGPVEELLAKRKQIGDTLLEAGKSKIAELGVELLAVKVKDVMFPGELRNIFAQVVNARHEGLAALERARGETAALRSLANAAKLIENNPALYRLRVLQTLDSGSGNTIVLGSGLEELFKGKKGDKSEKGKHPVPESK